MFIDMVFKNWPIFCHVRVTLSLQLLCLQRLSSCLSLCPTIPPWDWKEKNNVNVHDTFEGINKRYSHTDIVPEYKWGCGRQMPFGGRGEMSFIKDEIGDFGRMEVKFYSSSYLAGRRFRLACSWSATWQFCSILINVLKRKYMHGPSHRSLATLILPDFIRLS